MARRPVNPILAEAKQAEQQLDRGPDDWRRWWDEHGERELRCILMVAWDPVGAGDSPEAWDEYDEYIAGVAYRLRDTEDAGEVAAFLDHVERDFMGGLKPEAQRRNAFLGHTLVAWHEWSFARGGRPPREWIDDG